MIAAISDIMGLKGVWKPIPMICPPFNMIFIPDLVNIGRYDSLIRKVSDLLLVILKIRVHVHDI